LTGTPVLTYPLASSDSDVQYLAWSHDGTRIASVENGLQTISSGPHKGQQIPVRNVAVWNPMTGKTLFTYQEKNGEMRGVTWSPDDTLIATASMSSSTPATQTNNDTINVNVWEAPH
jgi:WD40 repeat protein